jgi:hypothetical protein
MGNRQSSPQREASPAIAIAASNPSFLQLPYEARRKIYKLGGIISPVTIYHLEPWINYKNNGHRVPKSIPKQLFHISREISTDVLSVFWSENRFCLNDARLVELLQLENPIMWSSLTYLTVMLSNLPSGTPRLDSENSKRLKSWRRVCIKLRAHLPPSQLTRDGNRAVSSGRGL